MEYGNLVQSGVGWRKITLGDHMDMNSITVS